MTRKLPYPRPRAIYVVAIAATAAIIALTLLSTVVAHFERDGKLPANLVAAERACAQFAYVSGRELCMSRWLAALRSEAVAKR
ncbi:MAG: hypothetical protein IPL03_06770 [Sterolibacteriaceae bacterium]|nr:hypothetical protein [Candidatus Methylophosphatis haderslevensis]